MNLFAGSSFSFKCFALFFLFLLIGNVSLFIMPITARIGLGAINPYLRLILITIFALFSKRYWIQSIKWWDILVVFSLGLFVFYSPRIYPNTTFLVAELGPFFVFTCLPFYLVGTILNVYRYSDVLIWVCRIGIMAAIMMWIIQRLGYIGGSVNQNMDEYMGAAYNLLFPLSIVTWSVICGGSKTDLFLTIIGVVVLLGFGTRGPMISYTLYFAIMMFFHTKNTRQKIFIIFIALMVILLLNPLLGFLRDVLSSLGLSSRVLESIINRELTNTETRDGIYEKVIDNILDNDVYGSGLFSDRSLIKLQDGYLYAHNIFLEILLDFGIYIGIAIFVVLFSLFFWCIFKTRGTKYSGLFMAFFFTGFFPLLVSGSYLSFYYFWLLLGVTITMLRTPNYSDCNSVNKRLKINIS